MAKPEKKPASKHPESIGLILLSSFVIGILSLLSFKSGNPHSNWLGLIGYGIAYLLTYLFGLCSFALVLYQAYLGWKILEGNKLSEFKQKNFAFAFLLLSTCVLLNLFAELNLGIPTFLTERTIQESLFFDSPYPHWQYRYNLGGVPLYYLYRDIPKINLQTLLSDFGVAITFSICSIVSFLLFTNTRIQPLFILCKNKALDMLSILKNRIQKPKGNIPPSVEDRNLEEIEKILTRKNVTMPLYPKTKKEALSEEELEPTIKIAQSHTLLKEKKTSYSPPIGGYQLPPPSLLNNPKKTDTPLLKKDLKRQAEVLEETLKSFGIEAKVSDINCGPTITSFEVQPSIGVKVQKIKALENDIALKLEAKSIRIIAPIPGKAAVGVEIPSLYPQEVSFKELLLAYQNGNKKLHIPILLGKTVSGENAFSDLTKMPHCIIAGATGSGKSVCINTIVMSILMNARPDEVKLLLIDPKKVELTAYSELPHLIAPVITEAHGAYAALNWLVKEMQQRYDLLKQLGLRNIYSFNSRSINKDLEASLSQPVPEKLFSIVAIIDEFADLMMASSSDLETPIARIAQMARAVGIHLILATQRPSREVITGLIKANFPTRVAFKVASRVNSQIILDDIGAESLLGNGDLLFLPPGSSQLIRAQGAFISDEEINHVIRFITDQLPAQYLVSSFDSMRKEEALLLEKGGEEAKDSLYNEALQIVVETKNASTTFLQRKLKIGYARAASLMDELEMHGVIGPQEGSKPRRVLLNEPPNATESSKGLPLGDF